MSWERENSLTHVFDPCWSRGRRLLEEEENRPVSADGLKTGSEKPLENLVCIRRSPAAAGAVVNGSSAVTAAAV